jgi:hypothetical protein
MPNKKFYFHGNRTGEDAPSQLPGDSVQQQSAPKASHPNSEERSAAVRTDNRTGGFRNSRNEKPAEKGAQSAEQVGATVAPEGASAPQTAQRRPDHNGNQNPRNDRHGNRGGNEERRRDGNGNDGRRFDQNSRRGDRPNQGQPRQGESDRNRNFEPKNASVQLDGLGLSEATLALMGKSNIRNIGDLTRKSEREMFAVQGFNKKMLFELRDQMRKLGANFKPDAPRGGNTGAGVKGREDVRQGEANPDNTRGDDRRGDRRQGDRRGGRDDIRGGRDENRRDNRGEHGRVKESAPVAKPERPTEPYPIDEWKKIQRGGKWGFFDGFKTVIPPMYDEVYSFKDGLASVELEEKCGFIDDKNEIIIPLDYEMAMSFSEGLALVSKGTKCGYINKQNEIVIPFDYEAGTPFEEGEAKVKKDGRWGTVNLENKIKWI